jgi:hypothetical protein
VASVTANDKDDEPDERVGYAKMKAGAPPPLARGPQQRTRGDKGADACWKEASSVYAALSPACVEEVSADFRD